MSQHRSEMVQQINRETIESTSSPKPDVVDSRVILQFKADVNRLEAECPAAFAAYPNLTERLAAQIQVIESAAMLISSTPELLILEDQIWRQVLPEHREFVSALCDHLSTTISDINSHKNVSRFAKRETAYNQ